MPPASSRASRDASLSQGEVGPAQPSIQRRHPRPIPGRCCCLIGSFNATIPASSLSHATTPLTRERTTHHRPGTVRASYQNLVPIKGLSSLLLSEIEKWRCFPGQIRGDPCRVCGTSTGSAFQAGLIPSGSPLNSMSPNTPPRFGVPDRARRRAGAGSVGAREATAQVHPVRCRMARDDGES